MMRGAGMVGRWSGFMLAALTFACGPVPVENGPLEPQVEQSVAEVSGLSGKKCDERSSPDLDDYAPAFRAMNGPQLAYGGGKFLSVWQDAETLHVYGTRIKQDGTVLDPEGIRLNVDSELHFGAHPVVAYDGSHFMVLWGTDKGITGVRVRPDGRVLGREFSVVRSDDVFPQLSLACAPKVCLAVYLLPGPVDYSVHFTPVRTDGTPLLDEPVLLAPGYGNSVAWNGKDFLVVWDDPRGGDDTPDIYGARVKPDGTVRDPGGFPIVVEPGPQVTPDVVWTGRRFLVAWEDIRATGEYDIYGARVRSDGRVDDPEGFPISTAPGPQVGARLAHHNSKTLVVWQDGRGGTPRVWGARVTEEGEVKDASGFAISSGSFAAEYLPDVAYGADRFFVGFAGSSDPLGSSSNLLLGTRVNHHAEVLDSPARPLTFSPR